MGAAIVIKKATPVATQKQDMVQDGASLITTVMNLVGNISDLNTRQKQLTEECVPSGSEISFVNNMVKEWAKTGGGSKDGFDSSLGVHGPCASADDWVNSVKNYGGPGEVPNPCYENFNSTSDKGTIWEGYPKAVVVRYCPDTGGTDCRNMATASNIYDVWNLIDFAEPDYTIDELTRAKELDEKFKLCSNAKLNARKVALWTDFLSSTVSGVGQKNDMANVFDAVGQVTTTVGGGGGFGSALNSITGVIGQFIPQ